MGTRPSVGHPSDYGRRKLAYGRRVTSVPPLAQDTRATLVLAARSEFREHGIRGTSLSRVATAAGVHRATLFRLFPQGRDELVAEVLLVAALEAAEAVLPTFRAAADAPSGVAELLTHIVLECRRDRLLYEAITTPVGSLLLSDDRLAPVASFGMPWWEGEVEARAAAEGWCFEAGARGVDFVVRQLLSLVREPGPVVGEPALRHYFSDFVVPVIMRRP